MSTTHIGKIGRLPWNLRHFLGQRIEDGIPNKELVKWLNESQEVKDSLMLRFGGRAITEQNLSEWKQTGHKEWVRREERRALALQLTEQRDEESMEPEESVAEKEISDRLGRELGMEMARLALELVNQERRAARKNAGNGCAKCIGSCRRCGAMIIGRRGHESSGNGGSASRNCRKQRRRSRN